MALLTGAILVVLTILVHHEVLRGMYIGISRPVVRPRVRLLLGVFGALAAHVMEILLFSLGYWVLVRNGTYGNLVGADGASSRDVLYFSFVTYASLGYGDVTPEGSLRFIAALEVLCGLLMLAWTASFLFELIRTSWRHYGGHG